MGLRPGSMRAWRTASVFSRTISTSSHRSARITRGSKAKTSPARANFVPPFISILRKPRGCAHDVATMRCRSSRSSGPGIASIAQPEPSTAKTTATAEMPVSNVLAMAPAPYSVSRTGYENFPPTGSSSGHPYS